MKDAVPQWLKPVNDHQVGVILSSVIISRAATGCDRDLQRADHKICHA